MPRLDTSARPQCTDKSQSGIAGPSVLLLEQSLITQNAFYAILQHVQTGSGCRGIQPEESVNSFLAMSIWT